MAYLLSAPAKISNLSITRRGTDNLLFNGCFELMLISGAYESPRTDRFQVPDADRHLCSLNQ